MGTTGSRKRQPFSDEQRESLSEGREQSRIVRRYLEALELSKPKRGRRRTLESITRQLNAIESTLKGTNPLNRLHLIQKKIELTADLEQIKNGPDLKAIESQFVGVAKEYSERKGISFPAWKELGVNPDVLAKAGITQPGKTEVRTRKRK